MAETCFNAPLYPILLKYHAKIRIHLICTNSRLHLMWYYVKMIFFNVTFHSGWLCLIANNFWSTKAREIIFAALERIYKYLIRKYNFKVTEAKSNYENELYELKYLFVCLFVLRFYGPVNPLGSCRARSVYLTTRLLGRLSPLSG